MNILFKFKFKTANVNFEGKLVLVWWSKSVMSCALLRRSLKLEVMLLIFGYFRVYSLVSINTFRQSE
jgi:hypothetical protein